MFIRYDSNEILPINSRQASTGLNRTARSKMTARVMVSNGVMNHELSTQSKNMLAGMNNRARAAGQNLEQQWRGKVKQDDHRDEPCSLVEKPVLQRRTVLPGLLKE